MLNVIAYLVVNYFLQIFLKVAPRQDIKLKGTQLANPFKSRKVLANLWCCCYDKVSVIEAASASPCLRDNHMAHISNSVGVLPVASEG